MYRRDDGNETRIEMGHLSGNDAMSLQHPDAAGLHSMWSALRGERPAPFRAELDAAKIGAKAPYLAILEHVGPSNYRIRIAGDRLNRWFGMELRGMSALSMIDGAARNGVQAALNRVVEEPAVAVIHGAAQAQDGARVLFEMVLLPMRSDFGRIDRILVGLWLLDPAGAAARPFVLHPAKITVMGVDHPAAIATPDLAAPDLGGSRIAPSKSAPSSAPPSNAGSSGPQRVAPTAADEPARPALQSIEGEGGASPRSRDRSHLRLVKNG
jgi:hypothetical protein